MKATLEVINQMCADGIIERYAIGGAVGATFYLEPSATLDVDVFVALRTLPGSTLLTLAPIYEYLTAKGGQIDGEHIVVETWPVQFLPASDGLEKEALEAAVEAEVEGVKTWVMTAEHLVALALRTGRSKDFVRVLQFVESGVIDRKTLEEILSRHGLYSAWQGFQQKYLEK